MGTPLEADFFLQSSPHDPYLGLDAVMGILLEIVYYTIESKYVIG